ncbi:MAG: hypothetical protein LBT94_02755, partial [Prevotellaceae bacterium]|nr:hypothetical protein [Prevotellaceae bacterium]
FSSALAQLLLYEDFELWAATANTITTKDGREVKLRLNSAQQRLNLAAEKARTNGEALRVNLLKCRQYGGTTYIRSRFNWLQWRGRNISCAVAAANKDQAAHAIGMFNTFAQRFPPELGTITARPYMRSQNVLRIRETGGLLAVGSMPAPEALSGKTFRLLHCTEIGKWEDTQKLTAEKFMTNLNSTVPLQAGTEIWRESTAKGLNFFHTEWRRAQESEAGYQNIFVGTYQIEEYQASIAGEVRALAAQPLTEATVEAYRRFVEQYIGRMSDVERGYAELMWQLGATLESIKWYFGYLRKNSLDWWRMMEEYPNTADEAFQTTGRRAFEKRYTHQLRVGVEESLGGVREPVFVGDVRGDEVKREGALDNLRLAPDPVKPLARSGYNKLMAWELPPKDGAYANRFIVAVDIGGTWAGDRRQRCSDFSVIGVFDRQWTAYNMPLRCVATWRGHIDVDLLAWKAAQLAALWGNATLVVERNYQKLKDSEGNHIQTILQELKDYYDNIYCETPPEQIRAGVPARYGFWTSSGSKQAMVDNFIAVLREGMYVERYELAVDELDSFERKEDGTYGAMSGHKDDLVITRMMAALVHEKLPPCAPIPKAPTYSPAEEEFHRAGAGSAAVV